MVDLDNTFNKYKIQSSHNSYISGLFQICACKSPHNIIIKLLNLNFRAIELDVYFYNNKIMVFHGKKTTSCIPLICSPLISLTDALDEIVNYIEAIEITTPALLWFAKVSWEPPCLS